jgi:hypothetical protein
MSFATGFRGRPAGLHQGCGGKALTFFGADASIALSCHEPKDPKINNQLIITKQRRNMNNNKFNTNTRLVLYRLKLPFLMFALVGQSILAGCASFDSKEESIEAILAKENTLIQKVRVERALPEVQQCILQSESLTKSESHLSLALEELLKANDVVTTKLMNQNKREVVFEPKGSGGR